MAIEIKELIIKGTVDACKESERPNGETAAGDNGSSRSSTTTSSGDAAWMIRECVDQVLEILRQRKQP